MNIISQGELQRKPNGFIEVCFITIRRVVLLGQRRIKDVVNALSEIPFGLSRRHIRSDFLRDPTVLKFNHIGCRRVDQFEAKISGSRRPMDLTIVRVD